MFFKIVCVTVLADFSQSPRLRHLQLVATKAVNKQLAQHLKRKGKYNTRPSPASRSRNMSLTVNVCLLQCRLLTSSDTSRLYRSAACMTEPVYCCNNCYKIILHHSWIIRSWMLSRWAQIIQTAHMLYVNGSLTVTLYREDQCCSRSAQVSLNKIFCRHQS